MQRSRSHRPRRCGTRKGCMRSVCSLQCPRIRVCHCHNFNWSVLIVSFCTTAIIFKGKKGQAKTAPKSAEAVTSDEDVADIAPVKAPTKETASQPLRKSPPKPRPKRIFGGRREKGPTTALSSPERHATSSPPPPNRSPSKRRRAASDEEQEENAGENEVSSNASPAPARHPSPAASQASLADFTSKRKRARR